MFLCGRITNAEYIGYSGRENLLKASPFLNVFDKSENLDPHQARGSYVCIGTRFNTKARRLIQKKKKEEITSFQPHQADLVGL
jgi:hypothetical protein